MSIYFEPQSQTFHLTNGKISYLMKVMPNGQLGQLYFGKAVRHRASFNHLFEMTTRSMTACVYEDDDSFSLDHVKQEYPPSGTGDFR